MDPPILVGRAAELALGRRVIEQVEAGQGRVLLVVGEPGIGKTRLCEELMAVARRARWETAIGTSNADLGGPYRPWAEALRTLSLERLVTNESPPELLALYLLNRGGTVMAHSERETGVWSETLLPSMISALDSFFREAIREEGGEADGDLLRIAVGSRTVCVVRGRESALAAVLDGVESPRLVEDIRRLVREIEERHARRIQSWDGNVEGMADFQTKVEGLLFSGRHERPVGKEGGDARRELIIDNVTYALRDRSAVRPLMLVLDDFQWADMSSIGLVASVVRLLKRSRLLVVLACRADFVTTSPRLGQLLGELRTAGGVEEIRLGGLPNEEVRALGNFVIGPNEIPVEFFDRVAELTGGNPLAVREALLALVGEGFLHLPRPGAPLRVKGQMDRLELARDPWDLVARRLRLLERRDQILLEAAAVCGTSFTTRLLAAIIEEDEGALDEEMRRLEGWHHLVRHEDLHWRFDSVVVREALVRALPRGVRRAYHRRIAETIVRLGGGDEELGLHMAEAGDPRAVSPLRAAAARAHAIGSSEDAARLLSLALGVATEDMRGGLLLEIAENLDVAGRGEEALPALDEAQRCDVPHERIVLLKLRVLGGLARWADVIRSAAAELASSEGLARGKILAYRTDAFRFLGRLPEAEADAKEALSLLPESETRLRGLALNTVGVCHAMLGRHELALEAFLASGTALEEAGDRRGAGTALGNCAVVLVTMGRFKEGTTFQRKSLRLHEAAGYRAGEALCVSNMANHMTRMGDLFEAGLLIRRGDELSERMGSWPNLPDFLETRGIYHAATGDPERADQDFRRCIEVSERVGYNRGVGSANVGIGQLRLEQNRPEEALVLAEGALVIARELGEEVMVCAVLRLRALALGRLGRRDEATRDAEEALACARKVGCRPEVALALQSHAVQRAGVDAWERTVGRLREALTMLDEMGLRLHTAELHEDWARLADAAGRPGESEEHLAEAMALFEKMGTPRRARNARALGKGAESPPPGSPALQVAR